MEILTRSFDLCNPPEQVLIANVDRKKVVIEKGKEVGCLTIIKNNII